MKNITSSTLKNAFMEGSYELVNMYIQAALGGDPLPLNDINARDEVWDLMKQLMLKSSDTLTVPVRDVSSILESVESGSITIDQATALMSLMQTKQEIEELPKILEKLHALEEQRKIQG